MTENYDPGMDPPPDQWTVPEYPVSFPAVPPVVPAPENVDNPVGDVHFADAGEMHRETITALRKGNEAMARLIEVLTDVGKEIIVIEAAGRDSQHIRFRVRYLIIARATAGDAQLTIGTRAYIWTVQAFPVRVDFPIVIERGTDVFFTGDGRIFLVGDPE